MKILYLPLKKEWYEMIERGDKREEYRENTRYWKTRLIDTVIYDEGDEETFIIPADAPGNSLRSKSGARGLITTKKPDRIAVNSWRYRTTVSISTFTTYA